MTKTRWRNRIKKACEEAGTYRPYFDDIINTLAETLEFRDKAKKKWETEGEHAGQFVIEHTNKAGHTNITKNPALTIVVDLNASALTHWKTLGIEHKGAKAVDPMMSDPFGGSLSDLDI